MKMIKKNGYNICFTLIVLILAAMPLLLMNGVVKSTLVLYLGKCISFAIVAIGLDLIWGYTGILSLGRTWFVLLPGSIWHGYVSQAGGDTWKDYRFYAGRRTYGTAADLETFSDNAGDVAYDFSGPCDCIRTDRIFYF